MRLFSVVVFGLLAANVEAGHRRHGCGKQSGCQSSMSSSSCTSCQSSAMTGCTNGQCTVPAAPVVQAPIAVPSTTETTIKEKKNKTIVKVRTTTADFDEVNQHRARRGLRPFVFDEGLQRAAEKCAAIKAANCLSGHLGGQMSDFACLEAGVQCTSTGADGSKIRPGEGWFTCCTEEGFVYAGAASMVGPDGYRYMSLFVR